jgi:hypothetical protein
VGGSYTQKPADLREGDRKLNGPVVTRQMTAEDLERFKLRRHRGA